jgi:hypothetical protein
MKTIDNHLHQSQQADFLFQLLERVRRAGVSSAESRIEVEVGWYRSERENEAKWPVIRKINTRHLSAAYVEAPRKDVVYG